MNALVEVTATSPKNIPTVNADSLNLSYLQRLQGISSQGLLPHYFYHLGKGPLESCNYSSCRNGYFVYFLSPMSLQAPFWRKLLCIRFPLILVDVFAMYLLIVKMLKYSRGNNRKTGRGRVDRRKRWRVQERD